MAIIKEEQHDIAGVGVFVRSSVAWNGETILGACPVRADYGDLLVLDSDGMLHGVDLESGTISSLCRLSLPHVMASDGSDAFGVQKLHLHANGVGDYAAIVVDKGSEGVLINVRTGALVMPLQGGNYYEETVPFSVCFLEHQGSTVFIHRTDWNRLDIADPATGKPLTERLIAPYDCGSNPPAHYLDYFHGRLLASPDGNRIYDDGWVWHPSAVPRIWSVTEWLTKNPWESEDGESIVTLDLRDDWNVPTCWVGEAHIALWGLGSFNDVACEETGKAPGVRIVSATIPDPCTEKRLPMSLDEKDVRDLFSDGQHLFVATVHGTAVWNLSSSRQVAFLSGFTADFFDVARGKLVAIGAGEIVEYAIRWNYAVE